MRLLRRLNHCQHSVLARRGEIRPFAIKPLRYHLRHGIRSFHVPSLLVPPAIFTGLLLALWSWKCMMLVLCQNLIIYNPYLPPNSRAMRITEYAKYCRGVQWTEHRLRSLDSTELALCVSEIQGDMSKAGHGSRQVYILYFQGNASSLPPRLPDISAVLYQLQTQEPSISFTTVCLSYRGYWKSHDRPSERGINMDCEAALRWVYDLHLAKGIDGPLKKPIVVLWGQSIGCGFATNLAAAVSSPDKMAIDALVLETPFTSTKDMLTALYPQKWLPYRHLWPFLRSHLDSWANIERIAKRYNAHRVPTVHIVEAGKDELVPPDHASRLEKRCEEVGIATERLTVTSAYHNTVMVQRNGRDAAAASILSAVQHAGCERKAISCKTKTKPDD